MENFSFCAVPRLSLTNYNPFLPKVPFWSPWNHRKSEKEEYKKKSSTTKTNQDNFKNIVSKTPFFKDFTNKKKSNNNLRKSRNSSTSGPNPLGELSIRSRRFYEIKLSYCKRARSTYKVIPILCTKSEYDLILPSYPTLV